MQVKVYMMQHMATYASSNITTELIQKVWATHPMNVPVSIFHGYNLQTLKYKKWF